jgi:hypothetical protein
MHGGCSENTCALTMNTKSNPRVEGKQQCGNREGNPLMD